MFYAKINVCPHIFTMSEKLQLSYCSTALGGVGRQRKGFVHISVTASIYNTAIIAMPDSFSLYTVVS